MGTIFPKRAPARGPALRAGFAIIIPQPRRGDKEAPLTQL